MCRMSDEQLTWLYVRGNTSKNIGIYYRPIMQLLDITLIGALCLNSGQAGVLDTKLYVLLRNLKTIFQIKLI